MNIVDIILLVLILLGAIYGYVKGLRSIMWLLVILLGSLLASVLMLNPLEQLILDLSDLGSQNYPGAPGVAVLILRNKPILAYIAALIPSFITISLILACIIGGNLLKKIIPPHSQDEISRFTSAAIGIATGFLFSFLFVLQLNRLPWPLIGRVVDSSLFINGLKHLEKSWMALLTGASHV